MQQLTIIPSNSCNKQSMHEVNINQILMQLISEGLLLFSGASTQSKNFKFLITGVGITWPTWCLHYAFLKQLLSFILSHAYHSLFAASLGRITFYQLKNKILQIEDVLFSMERTPAIRKILLIYVSYGKRPWFLTILQMYSYISGCKH